jgi:glycosyltransferase involved in cell wall biosynthesis
MLDSLERALMREQVDLVYFASPSPAAARMKKLNFIATVWDLCHRDWPEFPEVRAAHEYFAREHLYTDCLRRAHLVVTDSEALSEAIARRYGVDQERLLAVPFGPSPLLSSPSDQTEGEVLRHHDLQPGYLFYPAQFWSHKNHARIVHALALLRSTGLQPVVAFTGADKGSRGHVVEEVERLGLVDQVKFLGMVPPGHMRELYASCAAVVMPTYFGPTNLPPLEAWMMGKPLIYSKHLSNQAGDAAIYVDPDRADSIADAIRTVLDGTDMRDWTALGERRLAQLAQTRVAACECLAQHLDLFDKRRQCWK